MDGGEIPENEARNLRFLRWLVTGLTLVMIVGFVTIVTLLIVRFNDVFGGDAGSTILSLPDQITLPEGETATAFTKAEDWFAIVTASGKILIYDETSGTLRQTVEIE